MRVLHTADWHLGRVLHNRARHDDEVAVLGEIVEIARRERPDLIIHAGDLFDAVRPPYEAMRLGLDTLRELAAIAPTVVVCGNHDSPVLFSIFRRLLGDDARLRFIDRARRPAEGGILDYQVGKHRLRLAPLPFVHQNRLVEAFEDPGQRTVAYADRIGEIEGVLRQGLLDGYDASRDVLLFAAHLHVTGAHFSSNLRSERGIHVSETYATRVEHLPVVSYAAFGHIHCPQSLPGSVPGRYAGSLLQLDFGELDEKKQVVLVDVVPGEPARVLPIELKQGRRLARFIGTFEQLERWAKALNNELCLVTVNTPEPIADLSDKLAALASNATILQVHESVGNRRLAPVEEMGDPGQEPTLDEHFRTYLETQGTKGAAADHVLAIFRTVHQALVHEEEPKFADEALLLDEVVVSPTARTEEPPPRNVPPAPARRRDDDVASVERDGEQTSLFGVREAEAGKDDPPPRKRR